MAFKGTDEMGETFANVSQRTGASGNWDDLMVVQGLGWLLWQADKTAHHVVPKMPAVDGKTSKDTALLIAHFQRTAVKRKNPEGFVNPAVAAKKSQYTISTGAGMIIAGLGLKPYDVVDFLSATWRSATWLSATWPALARPLRVSIEREHSTEREISY